MNGIAEHCACGVEQIKKNIQYGDKIVTFSVPRDRLVNSSNRCYWLLTTLLDKNLPRSEATHYTVAKNRESLFGTKHSCSSPIHRQISYLEGLGTSESLPFSNKMWFLSVGYDWDVRALWLEQPRDVVNVALKKHHHLRVCCIHDECDVRAAETCAHERNKKMLIEVYPQWFKKAGMVKRSTSLFRGEAKKFVNGKETEKTKGMTYNLFFYIFQNQGWLFFILLPHSLDELDNKCVYTYCCWVYSYCKKNQKVSTIFIAFSFYSVSEKNNEISWVDVSRP